MVQQLQFHLGSERRDQYGTHAEVDELFSFIREFTVADKQEKKNKRINESIAVGYTSAICI